MECIRPAVEGFVILSLTVIGRESLVISKVVCEDIVVVGYVFGQGGLAK